MPPKLNEKRALFVLTRIDEILAWERRSEAERDTRFVNWDGYLCEVRAGQYWRVEKLKVLRRVSLEAVSRVRGKAYYLMSIHEHLPPQARKELKEWDGRRAGVGEGGAEDGQEFRLWQPGCTRHAQCRKISSSKK